VNKSDPLDLSALPCCQWPSPLAARTTRARSGAWHGNRRRFVRTRTPGFGLMSVVYEGFAFGTCLVTKVYFISLCKVTVYYTILYFFVDGENPQSIQTTSWRRRAKGHKCITQAALTCKVLPPRFSPTAIDAHHVLPSDTVVVCHCTCLLLSRTTPPIMHFHITVGGSRRRGGAEHPDL